MFARAPYFFSGSFARPLVHGDTLSATDTAAALALIGVTAGELQLL